MSTRKRELYVCDNLPVLRGLPANSVDLIYLDPPFNSKKHYAAPIGSDAEGQMFDDTWRWSDLDTAWLGEIDRRCPALTMVVEAARATQGDGTAAYLTMMGIRLLEMREVLKPTGSIYLHCDDSAGAYLRASMDAVFGAKAFRNEIVWKRSNPKSDYRQGASHFGRQNDYLLFYSPATKRGGATFNPQFTPLDEGYVEKFYKHADAGGRKYRLDNMLGPGGAAKGNPEYEVMGVTRHWRYSRERMAELMAQGRVVQTKPGNVPMYKRFLDESKGTPVGSNWSDVPLLSGFSKERTGWRTQKPLALLRRIVKASSNPGDVVLDPFCGCATACVAAEIEGRAWIGIDACEAAQDITRVRLAETALDWNDNMLDVMREPPKRMEAKPPARAKRRERIAEGIKDTLYGQQHGDCNGCGNHYRLKDMEIDHIHPVAFDGPSDIGNLQLLCGHCNSVKGTGTMDDLAQRLAERERERRGRQQQLLRAFR